MKGGSLKRARTRWPIGDRALGTRQGISRKKSSRLLSSSRRQGFRLQEESPTEAFKKCSSGSERGPRLRARGKGRGRLADIAGLQWKPGSPPESGLLDGAAGGVDGLGRPPQTSDCMVMFFPLLEKSKVRAFHRARKLGFEHFSGASTAAALETPRRPGLFCSPAPVAGSDPPPERPKASSREALPRRFAPHTEGPTSGGVARKGGSPAKPCPAGAPAFPLSSSLPGSLRSRGWAGGGSRAGPRTRIKQATLPGHCTGRRRPRRVFTNLPPPTPAPPQSPR